MALGRARLVYCKRCICHGRQCPAMPCMRAHTLQAALPARRIKQQHSLFVRRSLLCFKVGPDLGSINPLSVPCSDGGDSHCSVRFHIMRLISPWC